MSSPDNKLQFSVDSSLLIQLGQQLVAKPSIALAELVKNAYDADATQVILRMQNVDKPGGTISIEDDGHGMTFEEIQNYWMRIATTTKRDNPESRRYRRPVTGAKGIGRLAVWRLGTLLTLESVAYREDDQRKEKVVVTFDWEYFASGMDVANIPVEYDRNPVPEDHRTGVTLTIKHANDAWNEEEVNFLKRDLLSLQAPFPELVRQAGARNGGTDPGFTIKLDIDESEELEPFSGDLGEDFLSLSLARLEGWVDQKGTAHYRLKMRNEDDQDPLTDEGEDYNDLQNVKFQLYYFSGRAKDFSGTGLRLKDFRDRMKEASGVRVYLDGFRVFPYGEVGNDWLRLDYYAGQNVDMANDVLMPDSILEMDRQARIDAKEAGGSQRPFLLTPRNRQILGAVFLSQSREHEPLMDKIGIKTSREGLVENRAYEKLVRFLKLGIYWLTVKYFASTIRERAQAQQDRARPAGSRRSVPAMIDGMRTEINSLTVELSTAFTISDVPGKSAADIAPDVDPEIVERALKHIEERLVKPIKVILESSNEKLGEIGQQYSHESEDTISYMAMLRLLASAGTSLLLMQHQIQALVDQVNFVHHSLSELRADIPDSIGKRYDEIVRDVGTWHDLVTEQLSQLSFILSPDHRQRRRRHALREVTENVRKSLGYYMEKNHVEFINDVPAGLRTPPVYRAELYAVLLNIMTNALKAVDHQPERQISVVAEKLDNQLQIRMFNTGKRISPGMRKRAFEPFESDSIPNPTLGIGTGLGLTVVRATVAFYDGEARFIDVEPPWQTGIEITLPDR